MTKPNGWVKLFAPGIGDLVVTLPILKKLSEDYFERLHVIVLSDGQRQLLERFEFVDIIHVLKEGENPRDLVADREFYFDMAEHPYEKDFWWGTEEYMKTFGRKHIYDLLQEMFEVKADYENFPIPALYGYPFQENPFKNTVFLAVGGRRKNKLWTSDNWWELRNLLRKQGYNVLTIGSKGHKGSEQIEELEEKYGIYHLETKNIGDLMDIMRMSAGVITIDNGLMHIAGMLGVPTVAMFGPMPKWLWGPKQVNVLNIQGLCDLNCALMPLDWECKNRPCMTSITPERVADVFKELKFFLKGEKEYE